MLWVLLALVLLMLVLLSLPIELEIDTTQKLYRARWRGIFSIRAVPAEERWLWFYRIFFFEKKMTFKREKPKPPTKKKPKAKKGKPPFSPRQMWALAKNMIRAIRIKRLRLEWDTGDFTLNARLYPLFRVLSRGRRQLHINFFSKQELSIHLQTRLALLAWAFLQIFIHPKIFRS